MPYLIVSDIHGSKKGMDRLLKAISIFKPDVVVLLGDLLHGGYDIDESYVASKIKEIKVNKIAVKGNCDFEEDSFLLGLDMPLNRSLDIFGHTSHISHKPLSFCSFPPNDLLINGHTHVKCLYSEGGVIHLNPGSIAIPRDSSPSFALISKSIISLINADTMEEISHLDI